MDEVSKIPIRAFVLLSGGLDSQLAVCVLREQGIHVEGIAFDSPFFNIEPAKKAAGRMGIPLHVVDFTADILALLDAAPHGFGSCMNPCIDCHARMLRRAGERMQQAGVHSTWIKLADIGIHGNGHAMMLERMIGQSGQSQNARCPAWGSDCCEAWVVPTG
jgi:tRNA U34 2-thiouridine synthase MnmA/TrmU